MYEEYLLSNNQAPAPHGRAIGASSLPGDSMSRDNKRCCLGNNQTPQKIGPIFMTVPLNLLYIYCMDIYGSYPYLKYCTYFQHYTYFTYPKRGTILNTREFCVPMYLPMVLKNIPVKSVFSVSFYLGSGDSGNHCTA